MALKKVSLKIYDNVHFIEKYRPELRLYENIIAEVESFVPPEDCMKAEFHRLLSHPAMILRVLPEGAFSKGPRSLPAQFQFPNLMLGSDDSGHDQSTSLAFVLNTIRNFLLYRHLCQIYLVGDRPLTIDYDKMTDLPQGRCNNWKVGDLI